MKDGSTRGPAQEESQNRLTPLSPTHDKPRTFGHALSAPERKRLVLDAAARLFEVRGFHGTSMLDIASEVGITKAALYHYVKSKDQLLYEIHDAFISTMIDEAREFLPKHSDPREQLRFFAGSIFRHVAAYRPYVQAFFQEMLHLESEDWASMIKMKRDEYEGLVRRCLTIGVEQGIFKLSIPPALASMFFFGACNWAYQWLDPDGPMDPEALAEEWHHLFIKAFTA